MRSSGHFKQAYRLDLPNATAMASTADSVVLKRLVYQSHHLDLKIQIQNYIHAMESMVLERFSSSPFLADLYGYCATASLQEFLPLELDDLITPTTMDADFKSPVEGIAKVSPQTKVEVALGMAYGLAELHGYGGGVILQGDNNVEQFLVTPSGQIKLADLNLAIRLDWNDTAKNYCQQSRYPWVESVSYVESLFSRVVFHL